VEPRGYGGRQRDLQMRKPGIGVFAKSHNILGYHHVSLRIVPQDQKKWLIAKPSLFVNLDTYENFFATIGAGPVPSGCSGPMVSEINRDRDVNAFATSLELLQYPPILEDVAIERLFALDANYPDNLTYECRPDEGTEEYNSNSYVAGLLKAANIPHPSFPYRYSLIYPGWTKPVPANYFLSR
jgi:hypothetical protein